MITKVLNRILLTTLYRINFSRPNISSSSFKRLTLNSTNQSSYQSMIRKYSSNTTTLVLDGDKKHCLELNEELKTYKSEQILDLMKSDRKHDLDSKHFAICMERLYDLNGKNNSLFQSLQGDPRFEKLMNQLVTSAPHLSPSAIVDMIKFSHALRCPDSQIYALLKHCTNVIGDLTAHNIADLTETMISIIDLKDYQRCDIFGGMNHKTPEEFKSSIEWKLKSTNQIEVMMKQLLIVAESKANEFSLLTGKSKVDLLLAFGNNLHSVNSLLSLTLKDDLYKTEEVAKELSASLICLSSNPTLPPPPISPKSQMFPTYMTIKLARYKELLVLYNDIVKDRLSENIRIDDECDKLCKDFENPLLRTVTDQSLKLQEVDQEKRIRRLEKLFKKADGYFHNHNLPERFDWGMILTALEEFLGSKHPGKSAFMLSQWESMLHFNRGWESDIILDNLYEFTKIRYFPEKRINALEDAYIDYMDGTFDLSVDSYHLDPNNFFQTYKYAMDEIIGMLECYMAYHMIHNHNTRCALFLDELEKAKKHLSKYDLDFRIKFASYMITNKREIQSIDSILNELKSNLHEFESDESKINNALMFLTCVETTNEYSSYLPLITELKNKLRPNNEFIDNLMNKMFPGKVTRSPSAFNGYIIDSQSLEESVENSKKIHLTFHFEDSFWRNNLKQLRPLWHHADKSWHHQGFHAVPINVSELLKSHNAEDYLMDKIKCSREFDDDKDDDDDHMPCYVYDSDGYYSFNHPTCENYSETDYDDLEYRRQINGSDDSDTE